MTTKQTVEDRDTGERARFTGTDHRGDSRAGFGVRRGRHVSVLSEVLLHRHLEQAIEMIAGNEFLEEGRQIEFIQVVHWHGATVSDGRRFRTVSL